MAGVDPKRVFPISSSCFLVDQPGTVLENATMGLVMENGDANAFTRIKWVAIKNNRSLTVLLYHIF